MDAANQVGTSPATSGRDGARIRSRAAVVLGNDAVVAARPASAAQLVGACAAAGFDVVVPPGWGDELVARAYLEALAGCDDRVIVGCSCPRVRDALHRRRSSTSLPSIMIVPPPVAAARYLRATYGREILVTYVGDCPGANDPAIDARFSPADFLAWLPRQGVALGSQPNADADAALDRRRRYWSTPGGLPARRWLARSPADRVLREADLSELDSAAARQERSNVLLDLAAGAECLCTGDRTKIEETEPSRAQAPVVTAPHGLDLRIGAAVRKRAVLATPPDAGLERSPASSPSKDLASRVAMPSPSSVAGATPVAARPRPTRHNQDGTPLAITPRRRRAVVLALLPAAVLGASAALGALVYAVASARQIGPSAAHSTPQANQAAPIDSVSGPGQDAAETPANSSPKAQRPVTVDSTVRGRVDSSARSGARTDSSTSTSKSATPAPRRPPRRKPDVVPGWLFQGADGWTPSDTARGPARDSSRIRRPKPDTLPRT